MKFIISLLLCTTVGCAAAQTLPTFVVASTKIDEVRTPKNLTDVARDCDESMICTAFLKAASAYFQVPIDSVVTGAALLASNRSGEGTTMTISLPAGYVYCRSQVRMISIVPNDGPRGSTLMVRPVWKGLAVETWTPVRGLGEGRSWVEAELTILGIEESETFAFGDFDKYCKAGNGRSILTCRGGGCVDTVDDGQSVSQSNPSGNSRNR